MSIALPKAFWPVVVDTANRAIATSQGSGNVAAGTYYSAAALAAAVQTALGAGFTVSVSATGKVTIAKAGALVVNGGALATVLGFVGGETGADAVEATYQHQNGWYANDPPVQDSGNRPIFSRAQSIALAGDRVYALEFGRRRVRDLKFAFLPAHKTWIDDEATRANEAIERLLTDGWGRFRWWPDRSVETTYADYQFDVETLKEMPYNRLSPGMPLFSLDLRFLHL